MKSSKRALAALLVLGLTAATACSDDDKTSDSSTVTTEGSTESTGATETTAAEVDPLGEPNAAAGETLKVGYMWSGVSAAVDNSTDLQSAQAVTSWINEYAGGLGPDGRKLELIDCPAPDAATSAACGSTMVESGVSIVLFNVIGDPGPWATTVLAAGIPIFAFSSAHASMTAAPGMAFTMTNPVAGIAYFPAKLAVNNNAKRTAVVVIDVPGATGPVNALGPMIFEQENAGQLDIVPISPTAPDHSSAIQVELQNNPDVVSIIGNPAFCSLTIRALRDAGYEGVIGMIGNCIDGDMLEQLSNGELKDIYVSYAGGEDPENADYALFVNILAKYDDAISPHGTPAGAFVVLESFRRFMEDYAGDYSSADLAAHIAGHAGVDQPTVDGGKLVCDGTALAIVKIACTANYVIGQLDETGTPVSFEGA
ncbi:MAG: ABC transporter substrate-binding protein [Actinomycetota bacterium]|nr:ABC transporter substrate-binding protein [Actinomycetota bacterium]